MIHWTPIAGWMGFPYLSQSAGITQSYTLGYRLKDNGAELWTSRFNRFKGKERGGIYGAARLLYGAVPQLIDSTGVDKRQSVFLTALSSAETTADLNRALVCITKDCARNLGVRFELAALSKNKHQRIHNFSSADRRNEELDKAQYRSANLGARYVFVFDDFITRGDTISRIALAIHASNPGSYVYGVALAKNESVAYCPNPDNAHIPQAWDALWQQGEHEATQ